VDSFDRYSGGVRSSGGPDEPRRDTGTRFVPAAGLAVAAFSFMLTTVVWRLVHQTGAMESAVHESIVEMQRFGVSQGEEMTRMRDEVARHATATSRMAARLADVEAASVASLERMQTLAAEVSRQWTAADGVRQELGRATAAIAQTRQEVLERMAIHADRNAQARDAMIREVNLAIEHMERALLAQVEDFQQQKQQFDAAAERDRATRRAMLTEATEAFSVQVDGLRKLLDGLRVEAEAVEGIGPGAAAAVQAGVAVPGGETPITGETEPQEAAAASAAAEPTTAARDAGTVIE
jgi:hypothetical protein